MTHPLVYECTHGRGALARAGLSCWITSGMLMAVLLASAACANGSKDDGDLDGGIGDGGDAGPFWVAVTSAPTTEDLFGVWGRAEDDLWAVGWGGTILHYDGTTWTRETTTSTTPLMAVHGIPRPANADLTDPDLELGPVFAVGWQGTLVSRDEATKTWSSVAPQDGPTVDLFGIFLANDENGLAVGDRGQLLTWDGTGWVPAKVRIASEFGGFIEPKGTLKGVWAANANTYFVSGSGGAAYRSTSGFGPGACTVTDGVQTCPPFEALDTRISDPLRGIWGTQAQNVYTVGLESLILRYNGSWNRVRNNGADTLPTAFLFGVSGVNGNDITVVGWRGTVFRFKDGAWRQEWVPTDQDLRAVWVDPVSEVAYAVGATGTIIRRDPPPPPEPIDAGP
ncbi:MAG: hypothetical protein IPK13_24290 [Deltaproteobacteria bacterium]|nr:hypothetical protein [Deltaproteobacteria bacterium]